VPDHSGSDAESRQAGLRETTNRGERDLMAPVPRVALTRAEAAAALGMSLDSFERYVQPQLRIIRLGRVRLVATEELVQWARSAGQRTI
jgi:hypothetical protein